MFAIITRNKLRSRRYTLGMIWAWWHIRRQLARTPGMFAYTTGMASLTEFFTLTMWEKEFDMNLFMASDDHRDMMWNFKRWSDSFWSMRWNTTKDEVGDWNGQTFSINKAVTKPRSRYVGPGYLESSQVPKELKPYLRNITRRLEPETLDLNAVIGRIPITTVRELTCLKRILRPWRTAPGMLRMVMAIGLKECLVIAVWSQPGTKDPESFIKALHATHPDGWLMRFNATDFEIGHWNGLRIREIETQSTNTTGEAGLDGATA